MEDPLQVDVVKKTEFPGPSAQELLSPQEEGDTSISHSPTAYIEQAEFHIHADKGSGASQAAPIHRIEAVAQDQQAENTGVSITLTPTRSVGRGSRLGEASQKDQQLPTPPSTLLLMKGVTPKEVGHCPISRELCAEKR